MESTLFTTLTANEEVTFSGGKNNSNKGYYIKISLIKSFIQLILKLTSGAGGAGIINSGSGTVIVSGGTINGGSGGSTSASVPAT
ncbi:MAG: hypothetical protein V7L04_10415 [Nostoc sp.]|uniref:hypothetical protein n=1 Tax=unclassified Nostoc TaxID=2593658 RepID=UPI002623C0D7|nr:hypothetical protein [Nostoc sp. S13]MDF5735268.1 hypothetical protein [Nostoc sp. S13]